MKKQILVVGVLLLSFYCGFSQEFVCRNDSIHLETEEYRGEHFWQESANGTDWSRINGETEQNLDLEAMQSMYYRYEVLEGTCNPYYSDIIQIIVNVPPIVVLTNIDSVCINSGAFLLDGGSPAGGEYWGDGVFDGKFIASAAGIGMHNYYYRFMDDETTCVDTASAQIQVLPRPSDAIAGNNMTEIALDSIQLQAVSPVYGKGYWEIVSGDGGYFSDSSQAQSWFHKGPGELNYTLKWTVENYCGTDTDQTDLNFLKLSINPCPGTPIVYDAEGNRYPTVQIGNQCWLGENLRIGTIVNSIETNRAHSDHSDNGIIETYALDNNPDNLPIYGGLYDWDEMMDYSEEEGSKGICPEGWHVPSLAEWDELDSLYKNRDAGDHLKEGGDSGFEGQLTGDRHSYGFFVSFESSGFFWASTTYNYNGENDGWIRELCACTNSLDRIHFTKKTGASVRCIKNQ